MKFSVVSPTYNQATLLPLILEAWKSQRGWELGKDFEWILAVDGPGDDGTKDFAGNHGLKCSTYQKDGFQYSKAVNAGARLAEGEYVVIVNGDSWPKEDFLECLDKAVASDRLVTGLRVKVDENHKIKALDWRLSIASFDVFRDLIEITEPKPWRFMSANPSAFTKELWSRLGGYWEEYRKGREDWDFAAHAHAKLIKLVWAMTAVVYEEWSPDWQDDPKNIEIFERRLEGFQME